MDPSSENMWSLGLWVLCPLFCPVVMWEQFSLGDRVTTWIWVMMSAPPRCMCSGLSMSLRKTSVLLRALLPTHGPPSHRCGEDNKVLLDRLISASADHPDGCASSIENLGPVGP